MASTALSTFPFKNSKGDAKQALVDSDGHMQVDALTVLSGFEIPAHDNIVITYIKSGHGKGEISIVTYRKSGVVVKTLTLTYNSDDEVATVTAS